MTREGGIMHVAVLTIEHRFGVDVTVYTSEDIATKSLVLFCRTWWHEVAEDDEPPPDDDSIIGQYFERHNEDTATIKWLPVLEKEE